jgi:hypothetical protein
MDLQPDGSVTHWLGALKAGDAAAAQRLWERYSDEEVAARVDCSLRTVSRKLTLIRKAWLREGAS